MIINEDAVRGAYVGEELVCKKCISDDEWKTISADQVIGDDKADDPDVLHFCDRCQEQL